MFLQEFFEVAAMEVLFFDELEADDVVIGAGVVEITIDAELDDAAEAEAAFGADEVQ